MTGAWVGVRKLAVLLVCLALTIVQGHSQHFIEQLLLRPLEDGNVLTHAQFTVSTERIPTTAVPLNPIGCSVPLTPPGVDLLWLCVSVCAD